jgi:hypothetical protein
MMKAKQIFRRVGVTLWRPVFPPVIGSTHSLRQVLRGLDQSQFKILDAKEEPTRT